MAKKTPLAISYDFDGTLVLGNMQENSFLPAIKMKPADFWQAVKKESKTRNACNVLIYMKLMLEKAGPAKVKITQDALKEHGKNLEFFPGVLDQKPGWFSRINAYAQEKGVDVKHYIISSGLREFIEGTPIAKKFKQIYASSFCYDENDVANWPALAVNYTTKTQFLFRINKGAWNVYDNDTINKFVPKNERTIPFENMVFIGDGETDIPCFRLVREQGGHSIAVYAKKKNAKTKAKKLQEEGRVNFISPADYSEGSHLDSLVKGIIDKVACDGQLSKLGANKDKE